MELSLWGTPILLLPRSISSALDRSVSVRRQVSPSSVRRSLVSRSEERSRPGRNVCVRWLESSLLDVAVEHRAFLYSQNVSSTIICRGRTTLQEVKAIEVDQGCKKDRERRRKISLFALEGKTWPENSLRLFTFPILRGRSESLQFCLNNNGTLLYWNNSTEELLLRGLFFSLLDG